MLKINNVWRAGTLVPSTVREAEHDPLGGTIGVKYPMPTYVQLLDFTEQGVDNIEESTERVEEAKELIESMGGEFRDFYYTLGQYDAIGIADFPDDETYTQFALAINQQGNATTESLKSFTLDEFDDLVENLPG